VSEVKTNKSKEGSGKQKGCYRKSAPEPPGKFGSADGGIIDPGNHEYIKTIDVGIDNEHQSHTGQKPEIYDVLRLLFAAAAKLGKAAKDSPQRQQESNRIKNAEQMGCVPRERVMLKKHNTEREEKVLQTVQQNVSVKNRGYFCVTVLVKPWNRKGPKLERRKLKGIDEHKKNDGQSDKRQKNQCQNALPQGDPFCAKKVKKKR